MDKISKALDKSLSSLGIIFEAFDVSNVTSEDEEWLNRNRNTQLHPIVQQALSLGSGEGYANVKNIVKHEWPTIKGDDASIVEYTPSTIAGRRGNKSTTKLRTYIYNRFEPFVKDKDKLENLILSSEINIETAKFEVLTTKEDIVNTIADYHNSLCHSCMQGNKFPDPDTHPYNAYDPSLGWGLAILRLPNGKVLARALVNDKKYVQVYPKEDSNLDIHNKMKELLSTNGYAQIVGFEGYQIINNVPKLPHVDGTMTGYQKEGSDIITLGHLTDTPKTGDTYTVYLFAYGLTRTSKQVW